MILPPSVRRHPWPMVMRPEPPAVGTTKAVGYYRVRCSALEGGHPSFTSRQIYELLPPAADGNDEVLAACTHWVHLCAEMNWYPDDTVGGQSAARARHAARFRDATVYNLGGITRKIVGQAVITDWATVLHLAATRDEPPMTVTIAPDNTILRAEPSCRSKRSATSLSLESACSPSSPSTEPQLCGSSLPPATSSSPSTTSEPTEDALRRASGCGSKATERTSSRARAQRRRPKGGAPDTSSTSPKKTKQIDLF